MVFPTKNEAQRLPRTLDALARARWAGVLRFEVIVADDGSTDETVRVARDARVVQAAQPGVGAAVRAGVLAARGDRVLVCDADGAVPFDDLCVLWEALDLGFDVAAGSRRLGAVQRPQPLHRVFIGKVWGGLAKRIVPTGVADTQCGFKLFRTPVAHTLFRAALSTSFAFHVEVLALAQRLGLAVCEVPVDWYDVPGSKIRLRRDPLAMARELLALPRPTQPPKVARYFAPRHTTPLTFHSLELHPLHAEVLP